MEELQIRRGDAGRDLCASQLDASMNSFRKMPLGVAITPAFVMGFIFIIFSLDRAKTNNMVPPLPPVDPNFMVVAMGSSYDPSSHKISSTFFEIPIEEGLKQPTWNPATQDLPLPLSELKKIALKNSLGSDEKGWASWKVTNVEFSRLSWSGLDQAKAHEDRWACEFTLTNQDAAHYDFKTACLLLDGTYVPSKPIRD